MLPHVEHELQYRLVRTYLWKNMLKLMSSDTPKGVADNHVAQVMSASLGIDPS